MKKMRIPALLLCGALAVSMFSGCGKNIDKTAVVATAGEKEVTLGLANFAARFQQAQYDDFYVAYMGQDVWRTDMYGNGQTMEDTMKANVLESLHAMYALEANMADYGVEITEDEKAAIAETAEKFISSNSKEAIDALGATNEIVEEYLTLLTVQAKMYDEIIKDVDTNVSDEEANTSAYSYVYISKSSYTDAEGNTVSYTDEELELLAKTVEELEKDAKADSLETAAETLGYTVSTGTYNADSSVNEEVGAALAAMKDEEIQVVELDNAYYVLRMDAVVDEDATAANREAIISQRESDLYIEVVKAYQEAVTWTVDEKLWEKVSFDNLFTTYLPSTETVEDTTGTEAQ